jgi:hypothetical protein
MLTRETLELLQRFLIGQLQFWESPEQINTITAQLSEVALAINESKIK